MNWAKVAEEKSRRKIKHFEKEKKDWKERKKEH